MSFIFSCKKYKYFAATRSGDMPTKHKYEIDAAKRDMAVCLKGWPERDWVLFRLVYEQKNGDFIFDRLDIQEGQFWQEYLFPELASRFVNERYERNKRGARS